MDRHSRHAGHHAHSPKLLDPRFTKLISWLSVALLSLITGAICWGSTTLIAVQKDIAVLLARPEGVSKAEFDRNANRWDATLFDLELQVREARERHEARDAAARETKERAQ